MKRKVVLGVTLMAMFFVIVGHVSCHNSASVLPKVDEVVLADGTNLVVEELAKNLDVPWNIAYGADDHLWVTEQGGKVSRLNPSTGEITTLLHIQEVYKHRTLGLLGMTHHPDFPDIPYIYLNYTTKTGPDIHSNLVRYTFDNNKLIDPLLLLQIPGNTAHNGARLAMSKDRKLFWATGDAYHGEWAQDTSKLNGKVLRMNLDGSIPNDNPIKGSYVWAWGFRNIQGLAFDDEGKLYASEHGDAIEDEFNLIRQGRNYGWPAIEGKHDLDAEREFAEIHNTLEPLRSWTPVIAPAGLAFYGKGSIQEWTNSFLLVTLKTQSLRILKLDSSGLKVTEEQVLFANRYGRLRSVCVSPSGDVYVATSNKDWNPQHGFPLDGDDRILKLRLKQSNEKSGNPIKPILLKEEKESQLKDGVSLYTAYCASCHKDDGLGVEGTFPPLVDAAYINGNTDSLTYLILNGLSGPITVKGKVYDQQMPAFSFLSDEDIATITNYITTTFGNTPAHVKPQDVKKLR